MKILVMGGTGAMGKPLVEILSRDSSNDITVTSRAAHPCHGNVNYAHGNARDNDFLAGLLANGYDVIVDFMNYDLEEFGIRIERLLNATGHYIWFSSCRVYAESSADLTEESPRLLETSADQDFLATNRYALRKARQEDMIRKTGRNNYTIVRPYITYNDERLQLGILEKEQWLFRLLQGRPLVISRTMLDKTTTLSHGNDVALAISKLIGNERAKGETVQIAGKHTITWRELLTEVYIPTLKRYINVPDIYCSDSIKAIEMLYEGGYNTIYDRNYNRTFDSAKIDSLVGAVEYHSIREGMSKCLSNFLTGQRHFRHIDPIYEAYEDLLTDTMSRRSDFETDEDYSIYLKHRALDIENIAGLANNKEKL